MSRTPLLATALVLLGTVQAGAQEYTWTADRPDGVAPPTVFADRVLPEGAWEFDVQFRQFSLDGIRLGTGFLTIGETFDLFTDVPLGLDASKYFLNLAGGVTDEVTILGRIGWVEKDREVLTGENLETFFEVGSSGPSDAELHLLWEVFRAEGVRVHLSGGLLFPTGSVDEEASVAGVRTGILPYDMQTGGGAFGVMPGITVQAQNEHGSVGAQIRGQLHLEDNDREWRPGDRVEAHAWVAYRFNDFFSVTSGVDAVGFEAISGADPALDPFRDPGEFASSFGGERVDIPVGLNIYMPEGPLAGHRLSFSWINTIHEELDGPWLAANEGFVIAWKKGFRP